MNNSQKLFDALENGEVQEAIEFLKNDQSLINEENDNNQTPFWVAACLGYDEIIDEILKDPIKQVLDHKKRDRWSRSALDAAISFENNEIIEKLMPLFSENVDQLGEKPISDTFIWFLNQKDYFLDYVHNNKAWFFYSAASFIIIVALIYNMLAFKILTPNNTDDVQEIIVQAPEEEKPSSPDEIIAQGPDEINIIEIVKKAGLSNQNLIEEYNELSLELKKQGWDSFDLSFSQRFNKMKELTRTCKVELKKGTQIEKGLIELEGNNPNKMRVTTNLNRLRVALKSTRNKIISHAINYCFSSNYSG